jgi:hypothetical protein
LLARPLDAELMPTLEQYRRDLLAGTITFADIIRREQLRLALDELAYFAHWVTPEIETRRFDTSFFIALAPEGQTPVHDAGETSHSEWFAPLAAIEQCRRGFISLPPPTWTTLRQLEPFANVKDAMTWAHTREVPRVQPGFIQEGNGRLVLLPGDPLVEKVAGFEARETRFILVDGRWQVVPRDVK